MMERYQIETSQIHAPASLVERTKRAVQEEEKRQCDAGNERADTMQNK